MKFVLVQFVVVGQLLIAGCSSNRDGLRILEELRRDGLIIDDGGEVAPAHMTNDDGVVLPNGKITLVALLAAADRLNPRIAAARAQVGEMGGRAWQAGFYPNPSLEVESENIEFSGGGFGESETTVRVSQPIIISGRRDAAMAAGDAKLSAARWELERVRREVHGRIRREIAEIAYFRQAISLHEELRVLAGRTLDVARTRFEARASPESEAIRAAVEVNNLELNIDRLRGDMNAGGERLAALLGGWRIDMDRIAGTAIESKSIGVLPELEQLAASVRTAHPAVLAAEAGVEAAVHQVDIERAQRHADIAARFGVGVNHADDEGFIEAGVGIPLSILDQNRGGILAARFGVIRAQQEAEATRAELAGALGAAYRRWESATLRLGVFEMQILVGAQRAFEQASAGYEAGKLPFLDVLDAQRTLIEARLALIELRRSVSITRAEMYEILGEQINPENQQGDTL